MNANNKYQELKPSKELELFIHSFWNVQNLTDMPKLMVVVPDSFFKIIFILREGQIIHYFITGIWTEQKEFVVPSNSIVFGCRLRILAPEFLLNREIASISNQLTSLPFSYLDIKNADFSSFENIVKHLERMFLKNKPYKNIEGNKLRLSELLYHKQGSISAAEVANQIFWTNRQINRYLNKYIGLSLKKYLNIQKVYSAYLEIRKGNFFPKKDYFDQAHFIKEVKKHTGHTPTELYEKQNDRFIQLKHIQE